MDIRYEENIENDKTCNNCGDILIEVGSDLWMCQSCENIHDEEGNEY